MNWGGGGGGVNIRVLHDESLLKSVVFKFISKEMRQSTEIRIFTHSQLTLFRPYLQQQQHFVEQRPVSNEANVRLFIKHIKDRQSLVTDLSTTGNKQCEHILLTRYGTCTRVVGVYTARSAQVAVGILSPSRYQDVFAALALA